MYRDDWLERQLEQLGAIVGRMAGLRDKHDEAGVLAEAERGWDLLGVRRELVFVVDTATLVDMLGSPDKMRAGADLLIEEARATREPRVARQLEQRADDLRRAAVLKSGST